MEKILHLNAPEFLIPHHFRLVLSYINIIFGEFKDCGLDKEQIGEGPGNE